MRRPLSKETLEATVEYLVMDLQRLGKQVTEREDRIRELYDKIGKLQNSLLRIKQDAYVDVHRDIRIRGIDDERHLSEYIDDRLGMK